MCHRTPQWALRCYPCYLCYPARINRDQGGNVTSKEESVPVAHPYIPVGGSGS